MRDAADYAELVKQAQRGDEESVALLVELVRERLCAHVLRISMRDDLTQDVVQETLLEMVKVIGKLKKADRFWPWLCGIANNKLLGHYDKEKQHSKRVNAHKSADGGDTHGPAGDDGDGLAVLVSKELKEAVISAMGCLKPRHRSVLTMRCYEDMRFAEIADALGCSEFAARVLFFRAKKSLRKALSHHGLGKGSFVIALLLFGKLTAGSKAASAVVSINMAATKVGAAATVVGSIGLKTAAVPLVAAGVVALGTAVGPFHAETAPDAPGQIVCDAARADGLAGSGHQGLATTGHSALASGDGQELWYYFPDGAGGPVMSRSAQASGSSRNSCRQWLQNAHYNYCFDNSRNTVHINSFRAWLDDLTVQRLPTDSPELTRFLSQVDGRHCPGQTVSGDGPGLLVVVNPEAYTGESCAAYTYHSNVLAEEYFQHDWPAGVKTVDRRDAMHRRGWTFFRIAGHIGDQQVVGCGRLPFVYSAAVTQPAWLRIKIGHDLELLDSGDCASISDGRGTVTSRYAGGSFFAGMPRPWMGLHTIDTIRRDAARQEWWFETTYDADRDKAHVRITAGDDILNYTIDMTRDVVDSIHITNNGVAAGELAFTYLQQVDHANGEFAEPGRRVRATSRKIGLNWLVSLVAGTL